MSAHFRRFRSVKNGRITAKFDHHAFLNPVAVLGCLEKNRGPNVARHDLAPRLVLEVTETQEVCDLALSSGLVEEMRALGCRVALDDFSVGYTSPALLQTIPFDIAKIDRCFIDLARPSSASGNSLSHIISFAACYVPTIVVEGVETEAQALEARQSGATHIQGYFVSRPVPFHGFGQGRSKGTLS